MPGMPDPYISKPRPADPHEARRWEHTALRRRLLDGQWQADLEARLVRQLGSSRAAAMAGADLSSNLFRVVSRELAVLYHRAPKVIPPGGVDIEALEMALKAATLWPAMPRFQRWVLGCREYLMRVDFQRGRLLYRPVPPDMVVAVPDENDPSQPAEIKELRLRRDPRKDGEALWTWDVLSIADPEKPSWRVLAEVEGKEEKEDLTSLFLRAEVDGENYPYRYADGTPFLPYVLYHAEHLGDRLWDAYEGIELVEGALNIGVLWSFFTHCVRDASWPQRYAANLEVRGVGSDREDGGPARGAVVTDPASLIQFDTTDADGGQPMIGQFQAGADPAELEAAISAYANRLAQDAGLPASDIQRMGGTARSGYAIRLSNSGKREARRQYTVQFQDPDQELMGKSAALLNRGSGSSLPESDYTILHQEIPLSPEERAATRDQLTWEMEQGFVGQVEAYQRLHEGISADAAQRALASIQQQRAQLALSTI